VLIVPPSNFGRHCLQRRQVSGKKAWKSVQHGSFPQIRAHPTWRLTSPFHWFYIVKEIRREGLLGSLEHIVLLALVRLDGNAHGMIVRLEIEERTGRNISIGAVYATLERLEGKGCVSSITGEPTPERGGRAKRLFRVEAAGKRALQISNQTIRSMTVGLKGHWGTI
jgi:PadR family transcriptional regulator, regulatory protein PadR